MRRTVQTASSGRLRARGPPGPRPGLNGERCGERRRGARVAFLARARQAPCSRWNASLTGCARRSCSGPAVGSFPPQQRPTLPRPSPGPGPGAREAHVRGRRSAGTHQGAVALGCGLRGPGDPRVLTGRAGRGQGTGGGVCPLRAPADPGRSARSGRWEGTALPPGRTRPAAACGREDLLGPRRREAPRRRAPPRVSGRPLWLGGPRRRTRGSGRRARARGRRSGVPRGTLTLSDSARRTWPSA
jgi:hypothetical protein